MSRASIGSETIICSPRVATQEQLYHEEPPLSSLVDTFTTSLGVGGICRKSIFSTSFFVGIGSGNHQQSSHNFGRHLASVHDIGQESILFHDWRRCILPVWGRRKRWRPKRCRSGRCGAPDNFQQDMVGDQGPVVIPTDHRRGAKLSKESRKGIWSWKPHAQDSSL